MNATGGIVYLVDDEPGLRKALVRLLRVEGFVPRPFATAGEFLTAYRPAEEACLILDVALPELDGLELQRLLVRLNPGLPIIFLTGHGDIPMSVQAIKAGAVDFLTKPVNDSDLLGAVRAGLELAASHRRAQVAIAERVARLATLTPRERDVLQRVVAGRLNKEIADELGTGLQNIKVHRGRIMEKMGVKSLADLVRAAEQLGVGQSLRV